MLDQTLLGRTYRLLESTDLSYRKIADGSGVDINWVAKFAQRRIGEPGVMKVQNVHDFLLASTGIPAPRQPRRATKTARARVLAPTRNE